jgi:hypothetical protein
MTTLVQIAPRIAAAHAAEKAHYERGLSRCWQGGWHFYGAGPCCDTKEQAAAARDRWERDHPIRGGAR